MDLCLVSTQPNGVSFFHQRTGWLGNSKGRNSLTLQGKKGRKQSWETKNEEEEEEEEKQKEEEEEEKKKRKILMMTTMVMTMVII